MFNEHADEIDCVILDLTMPHLDGEETFRELRRIRPDLPVILASGYNQQDVTQRFAGKGLAGFFRSRSVSRMSQAHYERLQSLIELYQKLGDAEVLDAAGEKGISHSDMMNTLKALIK